MQELYNGIVKFMTFAFGYRLELLNFNATCCLTIFLCNILSTTIHKKKKINIKRRIFLVDVTNALIR